MYILTCTTPPESWSDNIFLVQDAALESQLLNAGYRRHDRAYIIIDKHRKISVICPEYRNETKGLEPVVIIPDFLVPRRPYPVYVYLYAISLYAEAPDKGQRWAAEETRKHFGLATFSHTTLGRALKSFVRMIIENARMPEEACPQAESNEKTPSFPSGRSTASLRKLASRFLAKAEVFIDRRQAAAAYCGLARDWFREYRRFLL